MSEVEIFYFSGTGNSLAVARDVAQRLGGRLISIPSVMGHEGINREAGVIGLVFPIYDFKPPKIVGDFVSRLQGIDSRYVFAICTFGIAPGQSLRHLQRVIGACGGHLSGGFAVAMPNNAIGSGAVPESEHERMFKDWKSRLAAICDYVRSRREGHIESSVLLCSLFSPVFTRMVPSLVKFLTHVLFMDTCW